MSSYSDFVISDTLEVLETICGGQALDEARRLDFGVYANAWKGVDLQADGSMVTYRLTLNDTQVVLHRFTGGPAYLLDATVTFTNAPATVIATALGQWLTEDDES